MNTIYTFPYKGKKLNITLLLLFLMSTQLLHSLMVYQPLNESNKMSGQTNISASDLTNDFEYYTRTDLRSIRTTSERELLKDQTPEEFFQNVSNSVWNLSGYFLSKIYLSDKNNYNLIIVKSYNLLRSPPVSC